MRSLLVAHDLSRRAETALQRGVALARVRGASLSVLHAVKDDLEAEIVQGLRLQAEQWLARRVAEAASDIEVTVAVETGPELDVIAAAAERTGADSILVGPTRHSPFSDLFASSLVERLGRAGRWPVLVAKRPAAVADYLAVLIAVDLSEPSAAAARAAARLFPHAALYAVRVLDLPLVKAENADLAEVRAETEAFLASVGVGERVASVSVHIGPPAQTIAQTASNLQADLLVLGSTGRGHVARRILGSVAGDCLRLVPVDTLVTPA